VSYYGPTPAACVLLDGLFLGVNVKRLRQAGVTFDARVRFHCYDLDFCRSAGKAGLKVGTWPLALTHASVGNFASPAWRAEAAVYLEKWR
jgi:GT2 family glycosyltransferase